MADLPGFVTHVQDLILAATWFASQGFSQQTIYRQFLPQVKDPIYPCISLSYRVENREIFADIDQGTLFVGVHSKDFGQADTVGKLLNDALHLHTFSEEGLIVYKCHARGGPPQPIFNAQLNCWEALLEFEFAVG